MNQEAPRYTSDAAGQVLRDGAILWQVALSTSLREREGLARDLAALLNRAEEEEWAKPGRRIFGDGERHEFLRPADAPARAVPLGGETRLAQPRLRAAPPAPSADLPLEGL